MYIILESSIDSQYFIEMELRKFNHDAPNKLIFVMANSDCIIVHLRWAEHQITNWTFSK